MENQTEITINVTNFPTLKELERQYLNIVLNKAAGSKAEAAKILGVSVKTVYNKLDVYKIDETKVETATEPS